MSNDDERRVSARLAAFLDGLPFDRPVQVVLQAGSVKPPTTGSRSERIAQAKREFETMSAALVARIAALGGEVLDTSWLNSTILVRLPARAVEVIAGEESIRGVDLVTALRPDAESADAGE